MKRTKPLLVVIVLLMVFAACFAVYAMGGATGDVTALDQAETDIAIRLQIGNPVMNVNGQEQNIDENGTTPVMQNDRTLLPVRAVVEAVGGAVEWDEDSSTATLTHSNNTIKLTIGSVTAYLNDNAQTLDVTPVIINGRTMLPIRFIAESFGLTVRWGGTAETITITTPGAETHIPTNIGNSVDGAPVVYFTKDISPEGLRASYDALGRQPSGNVAVKVHSGESEKSNYLRPDFIKDMVQLVDGTIVECNTAYGGTRANTALHRQIAEDHGFTAIADVDIMDEEGSIGLPVVGGTQLTENFVGSHFKNYDFFLVISHFKGHRMGGFGGAIKNTSIGIASSKGKSWIHSAGTVTSGLGSGIVQDNFLESMAEAAKSVSDSLDNGEKIMYINVMNRLSTICDCNANPDEPDMHDIGILASLDPVALDKACVDLIYAAPDGQSMIDRMEAQHGIHTLEHAAEIGLGSLSYNLVNIGS